MIFNRKNKIIGFKPDIASFGGKVSFSATRTFFGKLSKVVQKISKETPKSSWQYAQTKCCKQRSLWQKLFSLSLKPKEPTSGNRFGVTPRPWWGLFSWKLKTDPVVHRKILGKEKWNYYLVEMFYTPYLLKTEKHLFIHIRVTNISLIEIFWKHVKRKQKKKKQNKTNMAAHSKWRNAAH